MWALFLYGTSSDPVGRSGIKKLKEKEGAFERWTACFRIRTALLFFVTLFLPGFTFKALFMHAMVAILVATFGFVVVIVRNQIVQSSNKQIRALSAEWEIFSNCAFVVLLGLFLSKTKVGVIPEAALFHVPLDTNHIVAISLICSALIFAMQGGTHIVRAVIDKGEGHLHTPENDNQVPEERQEATEQPEDSTLSTSINIQTYEAGRIIGNIERLVIVAIVVLGKYEGLGFLIAAKGLVRANNIIKDEGFSEYFLVGTLTSTAVAMTIGLLIMYVLSLFWH